MKPTVFVVEVRASDGEFYPVSAEVVEQPARDLIRTLGMGDDARLVRYERAPLHQDGGC